MIKRVTGQQKAIAHVLSSDKKSQHLTPTRQDTDMLEAIHKSLHPLVKFTEALSSERYVSISFVQPSGKLRKDDTDLTTAIRGRILEYPYTDQKNEMKNTVTHRPKNYWTWPTIQVKTTADNIASVQARLTSEMMKTVTVMVIISN